MLTESAEPKAKVETSAKLERESVAAGPVSQFNRAGYEIAVSRPMADDSAADKQWDAFLDQVDGVYFAQSASWARVKAFQGYGALRLTIRRRNAIVAGA